MYIGNLTVWCSPSHPVPDFTDVHGRHIKRYKDPKKCISKEPDVILMYINDFTSEWRSIYIGLRKIAREPVFVLVYDSGDELDIPYFLSRGVRGFMKITDSLDYVIDEIKNHGACLPSAFAARISEHFNLLIDPFKKLTHRQFDVACALIEGKTYKTIATEQNSSIETIRDHVKNIYRQFEINSKTELMELKSHFKGDAVIIK